MFAIRDGVCNFSGITHSGMPLLNKSHIVYKFSCPGCQSSYIGKTDRTLLTRTREHAVTDKESAIYKHLRTHTRTHANIISAFIHNLFN